VIFSYNDGYEIVDIIVHFLITPSLTTVIKLYSNVIFNHRLKLLLHCQTLKIDDFFLKLTFFDKFFFLFQGSREDILVQSLFIVSQFSSLENSRILFPI